MIDWLGIFSMSSWATVIEFSKDNVALIAFLSMFVALLAWLLPNPFSLIRLRKLKRKEREANVRAQFTDVDGPFKLSVYNKGPSTAPNVRISFPTGSSELVLSSEIRAMMPIELLEKGQAIKLLGPVDVHLSARREAAMFIIAA